MNLILIAFIILFIYNPFVFESINKRVSMLCPDPLIQTKNETGLNDLNTNLSVSYVLSQWLLLSFSSLDIYH